MVGGYKVLDLHGYDLKNVSSSPLFIDELYDMIEGTRCALLVENFKLSGVDIKASYYNVNIDGTDFYLSNFVPTSIGGIVRVIKVDMDNNVTYSERTVAFD